uniref:LamG-like jellyroll fold domain-containing protein n=1 Tax=Mariniflexile sp. TaxID=1979402 RepID=UPI00404747AD
MKEIAVSFRICIYIVCLSLPYDTFSQAHVPPPKKIQGSTLISNEIQEKSFQINSNPEPSPLFFDSDGDGVYDDVDMDDDNDGIPDFIEENNCLLLSGPPVNYKFFNETFGSGNTISTNIGNVLISDVWANIEDHTPNDANGRMAIFNADAAPTVFYETQIKGTLPNVPIAYSFWAINIDAPDAHFISSEKGGNASLFTHRILPNITINIYSLDKSRLLATFNTGDITRCGDTFSPDDHTGTYPHAADTNYNTCETSQWQQFTQQFSTMETGFVLQLVNNAPDGDGNDFAMDDMEIRQTLCDRDGDGVADIFDLDSDNDGIPDVVEGNPTSAGLSEGKATLTDVSNWMDLNGNGMLDSLESILAIDTDGDGIPDYLDLDSDNDGLFDVDESGVINSNDATFQNGDGDITGNGVGDGPESETFRKKDVDGDGIIEGFGDGILDIFDFHQGNTNYADSYGNHSQGTGPLYTKDSDGDGIPDYRDPYNDLTSIYDIDTIEIYANLPHTAGVLDSKIDLDGDGIMASRDGDDTVFGSPRNLDQSYSLYFDGRNDYVEDTNIISSGSATLMAFIKSDGANTHSNQRIIAGQSDFYIRINTDNTISAIAEGVSLTSSSKAPLGIWMHVALSTTSKSTVLYINGVEEASDTSGGVTSTSNFMIGRATINDYYFKGDIDEIRVFNAALSADDIKKMVYQELDEAYNFNRGKIVPMDISGSIGTHLVKYYKMDGYKDDILDDKKTSTIDQISGAKMYNFKTIHFQKAPLPYITNADGNWTDATNWLHGNEWDITTKKDNPNEASIIHLKHNINLNGSYNTQGMVGLIVNSGKEFSIEGNKGLYNSWYLKLDGLIDLDDESQLIQTENSILDVASAGKLERDQKGTKDLYTYKYWCSPVGLSNTTSNNNSYKLIDNILKNGTIPTTPNNITFLNAGYNGTINGTNIAIADYWIWKYANNVSNSTYTWQHIRRTGTISAGQGFTMKGVESSPTSYTSTQNYTFYGKPNNGDIVLPLMAKNDYLIGNPYPSTLDANEFILDNISNFGGRAATNIINGTLYFWDHFANNTHSITGYNGGYATYTLTGALPAISNNTRNFASGAEGTNLPGRYIPVGQGFFVVGDAGGAITFKNSQRTFIGTSGFLKATTSQSKSGQTNSDTRAKIRLKFDSPKGYHRLILAGVDENASNGFDIGYDAPLIEDNQEDMFWVFADKKFVIQGVDNFSVDQKLPLGLKTMQTGLVQIKIDALENISNNLNVLLHDKELNIYHDLKQNGYEVYLNAGTYLNRFEMTFSNAAALSTKVFENTSIQVYFSNENKSIVIHNPEIKNIEYTEVFNILGQSIYKFETQTNKNYSEYKMAPIHSGTYIVKLKTDMGVLTKKVLIK